MSAEKRLIAVSEYERRRLRGILGDVDHLNEHEYLTGDEIRVLRSLADRYEEGIDGAEAHEVSGMFIGHWHPDEIDHGHPLYTGYLKLRQISDEQHPRYSEPSANYHALAEKLARYPSEEAR
jgi:hypothetical protein